MSDSRCKCSTPISVLGDGCRYCQPQEHIDWLGDIISDMESEAEPTHYAVIDEHGEIVQAWEIAQYRSAEILCDNMIKALKAHGNDTSGWTVKGVTVHE